MSHTAYIGVGSNIQDPCRNCIEAIRRVVDDERAELLAVSSLYLTSPVSPIPQQDFLNGALKIGWNGSPSELLTFLQGVEGQMGRKRTVPLGPRTIDLDILLFDDFVLDTPHLTIPHLKLHERKFALVPCLEIDPALVHPRLGRSLAELLSEAGEEQKIELFKSITIEV